MAFDSSWAAGADVAADAGDDADADPLFSDVNSVAGFIAGCSGLTHFG